ncbi:MAG: AAA family ATPase, partial [Anaerolineales bacterium]|nr:AAA family ATPase [Anaerolineales bacterium]
MPLDLISALAAYIPRDRVESILHPEYTIAPDGVALIADISGFTPLTEALTHGLRPDQGAEELTKALDAVFTPLIAEIHTYRGSVLKFGGDALIVWFGRAKRERKTTVIRRALTAAAYMQNAIAVHGQVPTPIGIVSLRMKIGMAYGTVQRFNLGLEKFGYEDVIAGEVMDLMAEAEHHAEPGDIMVDQQTAAYAPKTFVPLENRDGFIAVGKLLKPAHPNPWPKLSYPPQQEEGVRDTLAAYVPVQIKERLMLGQRQVAELKSVVSLFVQFHGLDYDHDPDIKQKLQTYFAQAQEVVHLYEGRLNRLITGDKGSLLHIIFGAPLNVEEQEQRAVRCALDLQQACGSLPFIAMQRIGLTAGRVFAGPVGSPVRHDYTTMGDSINLSARLMQNAADHQVLLDQPVRELLNESFTVKDLGEIKVKGKADAIHVFAAESAVAQTRRIRPQKLQPIFGRQQELQQIQQLIDEVEHGRGSIILLTGAVGMGKTLILDTLRAQTEARWRNNGRWLSGISLAYGQTLSGYLFIDLLRDLLELPPNATPYETSAQLLTLCTKLFGDDQLNATYPYLAQFMGLPLEPQWAERLAGLTGESVRWRLFSLMPELFRRLSGRSPLLISLDDIQWSDPTSLRLVETLLPLTVTHPICLLLSMRPSEEAALVSIKKRVPQIKSPTADLSLALLTDDDAQTLITHYAPQLPPHLQHHLIEKGGGNPLFLVELVRTLAAQGLLQEGQNLTKVQIEALDLPNSVQGLLLAQIDRLTTEARRTLQMAAVIGKTFLREVLAYLAQAAKTIDEQILTLENDNFIQELGRTDFGLAHTFRHILIQESAYSTLLYERRRAYHRQVAHALETLFPLQIAEQSGLLAHHYEQAHDFEQAIDYHEQTADQARLLYANEEAEALYLKILQLMQEQDAAGTESNWERRAKIYLKIAQLYANRMDFTAAQEYYGRAFDLLEQLEQRTPPDEQQTGADTPLRWGILEDYTQTFDPAFASDLENAQIVKNLFEGLVEIDNDWNIIPALAQRWSIADEGQTYQFMLKDELKWSDGTPLTAADFVFAWQRNLNPQLQSPLAYMLYPIKGALDFHTGKQTDPDTIGIRALDAQHLEITLEQSSNYFLYLLANSITFPQPRHLWADYVRPIEHQQLVSNGAFKLRLNGGLELNRNAHYIGFKSGDLQTAQLVPIQPTTAHYHEQKIDWCRIDDERVALENKQQQSYIVQDLI